MVFTALPDMEIYQEPELESMYDDGWQDEIANGKVYFLKPAENLPDWFVTSESGQKFDLVIEKDLSNYGVGFNDGRGTVILHRFSDLGDARKAASDLEDYFSRSPKLIKNERFSAFYDEESNYWLPNNEQLDLDL